MVIEEAKHLMEEQDLVAAIASTITNQDRQISVGGDATDERCHHCILFLPPILHSHHQFFELPINLALLFVLKKKHGHALGRNFVCSTYINLNKCKKCVGKNNLKGKYFFDNCLQFIKA